MKTHLSKSAMWFRVLLQSLVLAAGLAMAAVPALAHDGHHGGDSDRVTAEAEGVLEAIDADGRHVTLRHDPIPDLRWPAMTMDLPLRDPELASELEPGDPVAFTLEQTGETDYEITKIRALD